MKNTILNIKNLKKYFFTKFGIVKAIDGINLHVEEGKTLGLVGESGSGKSTVAYNVVGIYRPTNGKIIYGEKDISCESSKRSKKLKGEIQIVFQDHNSTLNPRRNIEQILKLPILIYGNFNKKEDNVLLDRIEELLKMVELPMDYIYKYPQEIGGGERQLISIARALATNPSLILLDEPTSALDVSIQAKIIKTLIGLQKKRNLSYLFITHDLSLMRNIATSVAIMYLGKICEIAPTSVFFDNPLHPYTQMLLSSIPVIFDDEEKLKPKKIKSFGEIPSPVNVPEGCNFNSRCPFKKEICCKEKPQIREIEKDHFVSCFFV